MAFKWVGELTPDIEKFFNDRGHRLIIDKNSTHPLLIFYYPKNHIPFPVFNEVVNCLVEGFVVHLICKDPPEWLVVLKKQYPRKILYYDTLTNFYFRNFF